MLLGIVVLEREQSKFTTDNNFFNTNVLLFIFSINKTSVDSACNATSDVILVWGCIPPLFFHRQQC